MTLQRIKKKDQRPAKIGRNKPFWTKWISHEISFVRTIPEKSLCVWRRRSVCRGLGTSFHCLLCILHQYVVSLGRGFVTTDFVSLVEQESALTLDAPDATGRKNIFMWRTDTFQKPYLVHTIIASKLDQNDLPDPYLSPSSRQFVESVKKGKVKKLSQIPTAPEFRSNIFCVKTTSR